MADDEGCSPWGRNEGCRVEGSVCYKDSPDCQWSVALAKHGAGDRQVWALKVGGRCGRMAIGLALDVDEVVKAPGGWTARDCEHKVWYYSSTGALRAGPHSIVDSGLKFGDGDVILLDWSVREGALRIARGVASSEPARVGFSSRSQPLPAMRPSVHGSALSRQIHAFQYLPVLTLHGDTVARKPEEARGSARVEVPCPAGVDLAKLCLAVTMFFDGACCQLQAFEPPEEFTLHDDRVELTAGEAPENWAPRLLAAMPDFATMSQGHGDAPAVGPPSVPRLSLTGVGDVSGVSGLSRGGAGSGRGPGSGREGLTGPVSGGREGSGSDRRLPSPDPAGPLSSRSGGTIASNSPGRSIAIGGDSRGALGLGGPRPSPRLGGGGPGGVGSSRTPRGLSIANHSPQITPRNHNPPASPTRRPSPRASPRALMSPRHGASACMSSSERFVSPRVPSPRTTPRGTLVPSVSPRKPLEALPATLTLQQHQKMEAMLNRIDTLEAMVTRTLAENRRLQAQVKSGQRAASNSDVCEVGEEERAAKCPASAVVEQHAHASGEQTCIARAPRKVAIKFRDEADDQVKVDIDNLTNRPGTALLTVPRVIGGCMHQSAADGAGRVEGGAGVDGVEGGGRQDAAAERREEWAGAGVRTCLRLSDIWEVNPAEVKRLRCIGRGACGTVWEGEWRRARVAVKDLDSPAGACGDGKGLRDPREGAIGHDKEMLASFRGEVEQLSCLRHPHILGFYGAVSRGDKLCMLVELMERDVRSYLRGVGREAALEARLRIGLGALSGVRYLHSQVPKVVHRDIKPENLLLSHGDAVVKICDLGLARTKQGAFLQTKHHGGTLCYVAPEVHRGGDIDEGCDVYAMAIVLWELATLQAPFSDKPPQSIPGIVGWGGERPSLDFFAAARPSKANNSGQELAMVDSGAGESTPATAERCKHRAAWPAASMVSLSALLDKCWAQDPAERHSSVEAHYALHSILDSLTGAGSSETMPRGVSAGGAAPGRPAAAAPSEDSGRTRAGGAEARPKAQDQDRALDASRSGGTGAPEAGEPPAAVQGRTKGQPARTQVLPPRRPPSPRARESGDI